MATFRDGDHQLLTCPYDPAHKVSRTRYAGHVMKCAMSPTTARLLECPFHAGHRIPRDQYEQHVTKDCPFLQRELLTRVLANFHRDHGFDTVPQSTGPPQTEVRFDPVTGQEYWD